MRWQTNSGQGSQLRQGSRVASRRSRRSASPTREASLDPAQHSKTAVDGPGLPQPPPARDAAPVQPRWRRMRPDELSVGMPLNAARVLELQSPVTDDETAMVAARRTALSLRRSEVLATLDAEGAVLLRGWRVQSAQQYGELLSALKLPDCSDYFPAEPGRSPIARSTAEPPAVTVWPTNSLRRTGGYLSHEILPHTENYYAVVQASGAALSALGSSLRPARIAPAPCTDSVHPFAR